MANEDPNEACATLNIPRVNLENGAQLEQLVWREPSCITNVVTSKSNHASDLAISQAEVHRIKRGADSMGGQESIDVPLPHAERVDVVVGTEARINEGDVRACI